MATAASTVVRLILLSALLQLPLTACSVSTQVTPLGGNRYMVAARGNAFHDRADLLRAAHQEAARVCDGADYQIVDRADGSSNSYHAGADGKSVQERKKLNSTIVFQCSSQPDSGSASKSLARKFRKMCLSGNGTACFDLASAYAIGGTEVVEVSLNAKKAAKYYYYACRADHALGCRHYAIARSAGDGVKIDSDIADRADAKACRLNDSLCADGEEDLDAQKTLDDADLNISIRKSKRAWACAEGGIFSVGTCYASWNACKSITKEHNMKPSTRLEATQSCRPRDVAYCYTACLNGACPDDCSITKKGCEDSEKNSLSLTGAKPLGGQYACARRGPPDNEFKPLGSGWYCVTIRADAPGEPSTSGSMCVRHEAGCERMAEYVRSGGPKSGVVLTSSCKFQPRAACYVNINPLGAIAKPNCSNTIEECQADRKRKADCQIWD